ncbi:hypothetical protein [Calothrix sp. PCC 6303]|uniref:hypothetical protein n=1 Tax=Calothrix sp. PCC 6303 TaxID=1170562 RepID=UPI0002A037C2|nr:hypothetical protein [Calothrix sp. PCC 6303]AFZ04219.1 hypothetical protein Cal6303_5336 [Calothrix sp. PCC 6303]
MRFHKYLFLGLVNVITVISLELLIHASKPVLSLPPPEDIPEEILRTEMITAARSPIDGKPLTAAKYAELQANLQIAPPPKLDPKIRENIFLLRLRKGLIQIFPFFNF